MKAWAARLCVALGGLMVMLGLIFIIMYVWQAVIARLGEPDQSLLFWYLPILFLGMIAAMLGLRLIRCGIDRRGKDS
jgi:ABC-type uncharacterized transport system permease subunit